MDTKLLATSLREDELPFLGDFMTAGEARAYAPQWGSYIWAGDPGYIMYTKVPPEEAGHRDEMVSYIRESLYPMALESDYGPEEGPADEFEWNDSAELRRLVCYLLTLEY